MKKAMIFLAAMAILCGMTSMASAVEIELSEHFVSQYVGASGWVFTNHAGLETELTASLDNGIYADVWNFSNLEGDFNDGEANEIDFSIGWSGDIFGLTLDGGVAYYNYAILDNAEGDSWCFYVGVAKQFDISDVQHLVPSIKFEGYIPAKGDSSEEHGADVVLNLEHSWDVLPELLTIYHTPGLFYDDGQFGGESGVLGSWEVGVNYFITENLTIDASWLISTPLAGMDDGRETETVLSAGLNYAFSTF